jgi:hypothetical protein
MTQKTSSIHGPTKKKLRQDTTDTGLFNVREFGAMCILPKTKKYEQNSSVENAT